MLEAVNFTGYRLKRRALNFDLLDRSTLFNHASLFNIVKKRNLFSWWVQARLLVVCFDYLSNANMYQNNALKCNMPIIITNHTLNIMHRSTSPSPPPPQPGKRRTFDYFLCPESGKFDGKRIWTIQSSTVQMPGGWGVLKLRVDRRITLKVN